jgi:CHAT domain-containing protein
MSYIDLGQLERALPIAESFLEITEKIYGAEHDEVAPALELLAIVHLRSGSFEKALPLQLRTLKILEGTYGENHIGTAATLELLARTYGLIGQKETQLALLLRTLEIRRSKFGPTHPETAIALNQLAVAYEDREKALPLQLRAMEILEKNLPPDDLEIAWILSSVGNTYAQLDRYDKALSFNLRALAIREKALGPSDLETADSLDELARTYLFLDQFEKALPLQQRALVIFEQRLGPYHPSTAYTLAYLSLTMELMGKPVLATGLLKQAANILQVQRERISRIGTTEAQTYTKSVYPVYQVLAYLLADQGRQAEAQQVLDMLKEDEQFDFIRRSSNADARRTRVGYTPTEAKWMTRYRQVADQLGALGAEEQALQKQAKLGLTPAQQARLKAIKDDLAVASKAFTSFLDEMHKGFAAQGAAKAVEVEETSAQAQRELQSLVRQLGPDVALLQYYVTPDKVGIILTTPGVVLPFSSVVDAKALNRQIFQYRDLLRDPKANPLPAAQSLYQLLVAPVAQALERAGIKTVMLSLDGNLRHVPFGALHDGKHYLARRWSLPIYTAVTKDKLRDAVTPRWKAAGLGVTRALGEFKALPAVRGELDSVMRASSSGSTPGEVYLDEHFTANRLKDVGQRSFQLMHVSSHFQLSPGTEVNSFLLLGDGQHLTLGDIRTQNYRFDQVDLLTLSACDTGLGGGRDANGKEIEGLGVIAQQQGAKAVLATLWPVADQSTATLMADMYKRRQTQALSKIEALRQAQLALMTQPRYAHPFYWAPFILMGNWK